MFPALVTIMLGVTSFVTYCTIKASHGLEASAKPLSSVRFSQGENSVPVSHRVEQAGGLGESHLASITAEDKEKLSRMQQLMDAGSAREALSVARDLMDSQSSYVRAEVVSCMGHVGLAALPELIELADDQSFDVAMAAETEIDHVLAEIPSEASCASRILEETLELTKTSAIESMLQRLYRMDSEIALLALSDFIAAKHGGIHEECAREAYEHLTGGEPWVSQSETAKFLAKEKQTVVTSEKQERIQVKNER